MKISIIIPVYNAENTIERCVQSFLVQNYSDLELLLIEDHSEDYSYEKCLELKKKYSQVLVFQNEGKGVSSARNHGLCNSTGDYVFFLDSDDCISNNTIFDLLTNPVEILMDENSWVSGIKCIKMELGEPDASGRRRPVEVKGSEFVIDCDTVIMSLGTSPNPLISSTTEGLEVNKYKCIIADENNGKTTKEGVFAGGDAVTGAATVILAMGAGRAGAQGIHEYLSNK